MLGNVAQGVLGDGVKIGADILAARDPTLLVEALRKLSCLGNGDRPGNSIGNEIAREALAAWEAK